MMISSIPAREMKTDPVCRYRYITTVLMPAAMSLTSCIIYLLDW